MSNLQNKIEIKEKIMLACPKCGANIDSEGYCTNSRCIYSSGNIPPFKPGIRRLAMLLYMKLNSNKHRYANAYLNIAL